MDTVAGRQVGRMRIELPGHYEENVVPVGLQIEVVEQPGREPGQESVPVKDGAK